MTKNAASPLCPHYAVLGNPVQHSLSPQIHRSFAEQTGIQLDYTTLTATPNSFAQVLQTFQRQGGAGLNITAPFKQQAVTCMTKLADSAKRAQAVNTVLLTATGERIGHNTDEIGFIRAMQPVKAFFAGKRVLLIGAGGVVRAILFALTHLQVAQITLSNRTEEKAQRLVQRCQNDLPLLLNYCPKNQLSKQRFDVAINATTAGLHGTLPPIPEGVVASSGLICDLNYGAASQVFADWSQKQTIQYLDGMTMLIEQAAESFYLWHQKKPLSHKVSLSLK